MRISIHEITNSEKVKKILQRIGEICVEENASVLEVEVVADMVDRYLKARIAENNFNTMFSLLK